MLRNLLPTRSFPSAFALPAALALSAFAGSAFAADPVTQSGITAHAGVWPVMVRMDYNPVMKITVNVSEKAVNLQEFKLDFSKTTNPNEIDGVDVYIGGDVVKPGEKFATVLPSKTSPIVTAKGKLGKLSVGANDIWISVRMKNRTDISGKISFVVTNLKIAGLNKQFTVSSKPTEQRIGYAVAKTGDLGSKNYRIPAITATKKGTLVATYDIRYNHAGDLPANIDIGVSRSTDGGNTWTMTESVLTSKEMEVKKGVGDPGILYDEKNDAVWISALWAPESGHPIWSSSAGTVSPKNCGQMLLIKSTNDGKTWSKPINITESIKRLGDADTKNWGLIFQGPGAGICTKDGTLIFPGQVWMKNPSNGKTEGEGASQGVLIYSKDGGKTWHSTKGSPFGGSESTCLEKKNGSIALNTRTNKGWGRTGSILKKVDSKTDWEIDENLTRGSKGALPQPGGCQGALLSVGGDWFFSNPNSGKRDHMTIKYSKNEGKTWSDGLLYDERGCAGYSSLVSIAGGKRIGVLYEGSPGSQIIAFLSIPADEIKNAKKAK